MEFSGVFPELCWFCVSTHTHVHSLEATQIQFGGKQ